MGRGSRRLTEASKRKSKARRWGRRSWEGGSYEHQKVAGRDAHMEDRRQGKGAGRGYRELAR